MSRDEILVIGAGPAGIASAYHLERAGLPYRVIDRAPIPGSTWASLYPSLRLNTASFVSHLPGKRIPLHYSPYPLGSQYYEYLAGYVAQHDFCLQFDTIVHSVAREGNRWRVETDRGVSLHRTAIIATGRFGNPYTPPIEGLDSFTGRAIHAHDFRDPRDFTGQRVLVVGAGPSGADIAAALSEYAGETLIAIRHDLVMARRYPLGLPETAWRLIVDRAPMGKRLRQAVENRLLYMPFPHTNGLGINFAPNRTHRRGTSAPIRGPEFLGALRQGAIRPVAGLARLEGSRAIMMDGAILEPDVVILSTGYRPVLDYLDIEYETDRDGWPRRISDQIEGGSTAVLDHPGLFLVGRYYRGLGPLYNIRQEAALAVREIGAYLT